MASTYEEISVKADIVRNISLIEVLKRSGAEKDNFDKAKWHTDQGVISVTGQKFMNWTQRAAGGGAIDLVIHLLQSDYKSAVIWLCDNIYSQTLQHAPPTQQQFSQKSSLILPGRCDSKWPRVKNYLEHKRRIPKHLIEFLTAFNRLYADNMGNAVFLLLGKEKRIVGAELRGTGSQKWRGMAPGSRKDMGCFSIHRNHSKHIIICESAIDAVSYFAMNNNCIAISTSGVNSNPEWLSRAIKKDYQIYCGFDSDERGDLYAAKMISQFPTVKRLRPLAHDWNDLLLSIIPPS